MGELESTSTQRADKRPGVGGFGATHDGGGAGLHGARGEGFRATVENAGLWDLVQLSCSSRARAAACVRSGSRSGYLYFAGGQIVHATTGGVQGERAALDILSWRKGTWEACDAPWPASPTIAMPWQGLLLRAAQRQDETLRPSPLIAVGGTDEGVAVAASAAATVQPSSEPAAKGEAASPSYRSSDFEHAVRMDASGTVIAGSGRAEELAALSAYVCGVGDVIGALLGMGNMIALDATLARGVDCLVYRRRSGDTIALRPREGVDLARLKTQLQL